MCQWAPSEHIHHHPPSHPLAHAVLPCLLATCLVPAAGCYLSVSARWFLPAGVKWLSCLMCTPELQSPPPSSFAGTVGWNMQERNYCRKASVEIPVLSPADSTCLWKVELKGWNPHKWSLNVVLQKEIVLILLELNGHGSRKKKRARKGTKGFREVLLSNVSGSRHNRFSKFCFLK